MNLINYISNIAMPLFILLIMIFGLKSKINNFDVFIKGAEDGLKIIYNIFPTLIGLFFAIELLNKSGVLNIIINFLSPVLNVLGVPKEIMPLALLRPISGSASTAVATNIISKNGVDSKIGLITATIMGATETTLYTIAVYTGAVKIKNIRFVLFASLAADITGMLASVAIWHFLS